MHEVKFNPFPVLTTPRLTLRQMQLTDDRDVFMLRSDEAVVKYQDRPLTRTVSEARQFIRKINEGLTRSEWIFWAIALNEDDRLIGTICLWNIAPDEAKAEAGYELLPAMQGRGMMQEALQAVIKFGFETMKLQSIEAFVNPANTKSIKLLERNAFAHVGTFKESSDFELNVYVLNRQDG